MDEPSPQATSSPRGLRQSDSDRNSREGKVTAPTPKSSKKGISILKSATPLVARQTATPRASLIPRPSGTNNSSYKRKVVVSFATSPFTGHKSSTEPAPCDDVSVENIEPRTPCHSSRRVLAGHTPGYIPRGIPDSSASESRESTFSESAVVSDDEVDEQMSNLVASFTASPGSPERVAPSTPQVLSTPKGPTVSDIFSSAASAKGKPPSRAQEVSSSISASRVYSSKSTRPGQNEHTPQNESATPSTLFYSSSESEGASESRFMESRVDNDCDNNGVCLERPAHSTRSAAPTIVSQPASVLEKPTFLASLTDQTPLVISTEQGDHADDTASPLDFSQPNEPDFCKSIGLEVPHHQHHRDTMSLDYNTEFVAVSTRNVESVAPAERHRGSFMVPSSCCIGSPVHSVPKLSRNEHKRLESKNIVKCETKEPHSVAPQMVDAPQEKVPELIAPLVAEAPRTGVRILPADARSTAAPSKEVSLSRPGLRRAYCDRSASTAVAGGCLSETERTKSLPFIILGESN